MKYSEIPEPWSWLLPPSPLSAVIIAPAVVWAWRRMRDMLKAPKLSLGHGLDPAKLSPEVRFALDPGHAHIWEPCPRCGCVGPVPHPNYNGHACGNCGQLLLSKPSR